MKPVNNGAKLLFVGLSLFGLLSISLLYGGIDRLKRTKTPPFADEGLYTAVTLLPRPSDNLLKNLDLTVCRVALWTLALATPIAAALAIFRAQRTFLGVLLLAGWSCAAGFAGFWIWIYGMFHSLSA